MSWNFEQDFMGWGNQADEEELSEEELAQELEAYLQALESGGGLPNVGRDMQDGSWREGSPPPSSIRRLNRKNGEVGAIQDLASREMPNIGRAMQEGSWRGSPAPQQPMQQPGALPPFDQHISPDDIFNQMNSAVAPGVNAQGALPQQQQQPGAPSPFDQHIPPDDMFNQMNVAPGVNAQGAWPQQPMAEDPAGQDLNDSDSPMTAGATPAQTPQEFSLTADGQLAVPSVDYDTGERTLRPLTPTALGIDQAEYDRRVEAVRQGNPATGGQLSPDRVREIRGNSPISTPENEARNLEEAYSNTSYAGMSPEDRALMQLQPNESRNSLRRTFEGFGVPVEFQGVSDGSTMPVVPSAYMGRMGLADASQTPNMRGAVFDDEMVDGVPTFTNESIRRREQLGWLPKAADEQARIERDAQEDFERRPEVRAVREQTRLDQESKEAELTTEYNLKNRNRLNEISAVTGAPETPASRPTGWQALVGEDGNLNIAALNDNPEESDELARHITSNIRRMAQQSGLLGEERGQTRESDIEAFTSRLLMASAREQQGENPSLPSHLPVEVIQDLALMSLSLANRTKNTFRKNPGQFAANSLGDTLDTMTDLISGRGKTRSSAGQKFDWKDLSGEERRIVARLTSSIDELASRDPSNPRFRQYVNGRVSQLESDIKKAKNTLSPSSSHPRFVPAGAPGSFHGTPSGANPVVSPQQRAQLEAELATLERTLAAFRGGAAASIRRQG